MGVKKIQKELKRAGSKKQARILQRFFKTGPGDYGEGDVFLGVRVPETRKIARKYRDLSISDTLKLLKSKIHEERLLALLIWVDQFQSGDKLQREKIFLKYLGNTRWINNWDLVDLSAPQIIGGFLVSGAKKPLYVLAKSKDLWERRISILSTFYFIKEGKFADTLRLSGLLLGDTHDLIHKAVGWMLREVGKRDLRALEGFLKANYTQIPRTMLRYAIERLPEGKRQGYLKGTVR